MVASNYFSHSSGPVASASGRIRATTESREAALHDASLVRRFIEDGDESAFAEIIKRYRVKMYGIALALLKNRADAEEIVQDTFIRAHRGLANFRGDSTLSTWLHRIALNLSRNRYWYFSRRQRHATLSFDCPLPGESTVTFASLVASPTPTPVEHLTISEFTILVAECMEQLGPGHRDILTRRNVLHCTYGQIAADFGISVGTVKSRIARARSNLRGLMAKACPEFESGALASQWFDPSRPTGRIGIIFA